MDAVRTLGRGPGATPPPTRASAVLGSIVASLQALEIGRLLTGRIEQSIVGIEHYHDLSDRAAVTTRLLRNEDCRFDHVGGPGEIIADLTLGDLLARVPGATALAVQGQSFVRSLGCLRCGTEAGITWRLVRELDAQACMCPSCRRASVPTGMDLADAIPAAELDARRLAQRLSELGIREGDLVLVWARGRLRLFERRSENAPDAADMPRTVIIVGLGNIGSNLVDLLVRTHSPAIERLVLIDPDTYDRTNLMSQRMSARDVGHPKATVQARRALRMRPMLSVFAYVAKVEDVPVGIFRGAIVAGCLDSRAARQSLAEIAWRMGAPLVDAAVSADVPAVRIAGYMAGPGRACLECSFHEADYAALEQTVSCGS